MLLVVKWARKCSKLVNFDKLQWVTVTYGKIEMFVLISPYSKFDLSIILGIIMYLMQFELVAFCRHDHDENLRNLNLTTGYR